MRCKYFNILNLVIILFYLLSPSLPYIEYAVNREYIEKNLCVERNIPGSTCHGKCHLHKQVNNQSEQRDADTPDNNKPAPSKKTDDQIKGSDISPERFEKKIIISDNYSFAEKTTYISDIFVPPRF